MRIIYAGTPAFSVPALSALVASGHQVLAVYSQPDRPAGRGRQPKASDVKQYALSQNLRVEQPETLKSSSTQQVLADYQPDLMIVTAYGLLLPSEVLAIPKYGCINIHASLLPRWRGAAPIQRAILSGDLRTGVCIMQMEEGLDTGPVLASHSIKIKAGDTSASLHTQLAQVGADCLLEFLPRLVSGDYQPQQQQDALVTYASKLSKAEALLDWRLSAVELDRNIRGYNPWPVAYTSWNGQLLRIWEAGPVAVESAPGAEPGQVLIADKNGILVNTGVGMLQIKRVQVAGKQVQQAADFVNAHQLDGVVLGAV